MILLRLPDPELKLLFENDEIIAIDKPYGIDTHTNEAKAGNEGFIQQGLIEIFESQLDRKLHIVHRLDRTTTGVIIFAKTLEAAKKYQGYFRARETKKTYLFVTASSSAGTRLSSEKEILRNGALLEAKTEFERLNLAAGFELWCAKPKTGRNHQIRIHSADVGIPILGDTKYGGAKFSFICLHNARIEFPDGLTIESTPPIYFEDLALLKDIKLTKALFEIDRRRRLFDESGAPIRLFSILERGETKSTTLDRLGDIDLMTLHRDDWSPADQEFALALSSRLKLQQTSIRQLHARVISSAQPGKSAEMKRYLVGKTHLRITEPENWVIEESNVRFELKSEVGPSSGFAIDQRSLRAWIRRSAKNKSVLHLFAQTCSLGVCAALGGAREVISVESNKGLLNRGRKNFEINAIASDRCKFFLRDSLIYLEQCRAKDLKFDLLILDVPSFHRGEKGNFKVEAGLAALLKSASDCVEKGGRILLSVSSEKLTVGDIATTIRKTLSHTAMSHIQPGLDISLPGAPSTLKSFLLQFP